MGAAMKTAAVILSFSLAAFFAFAQEPKKEAPATDAPAKDVVRKRVVLPADAPPEDIVRRRVVLPTTDPNLEAKFKATLTNAVMDGRYCTLADGKLGPDKEDKYTIVGVEKTADGQWTISAKIEYGAVNFTAPVAVQVKWAGDTPVIIVDNIGFPGTPKYSARVMIYGDTYSGTWSAGDHGGLMHGVIRKAEEKAAKTEEKK